MSNYMTKAAAHARLLKLASAARLIRRQRALQKYAQAVQMQKAALSTGAQAGIGAGLGGLIGGGIGYGLGKKDKKLLSALIGAGAGAGIGGLGGWGLGSYLNRDTNPSHIPTSVGTPHNDLTQADVEKMYVQEYGRSPAEAKALATHFMAGHARDQAQMAIAKAVRKYIADGTGNIDAAMSSLNDSGQFDPRDLDAFYKNPNRQQLIYDSVNY